MYHMFRKYSLVAHLVLSRAKDETKILRSRFCDVSGWPMLSEVATLNSVDESFDYKNVPLFLKIDPFLVPGRSILRIIKLFFD